MKNIPVILLVAGVAFLAGCIAQGPSQDLTQPSQIQTPSQAPIEKAVSVNHGWFNPRDITIQKGDTVTWKNAANFGGLPYSQHTLTSGKIDSSCSQGKPGVLPNTGCGIADGKFAGALDGSKDFSFTFNQEGNYTYYIAEHPTLAGVGTIVVTGSGSSGTVKQFRANLLHGGYSFYDAKGNLILFKITVNKGDTVRFLAATDSPPHNHGITIDEYGINEVVNTDDTSNPKVIEFTADKAGKFRIYCGTCPSGIAGPHLQLSAELEVK